MHAEAEKLILVCPTPYDVHYALSTNETKKYQLNLNFKFRAHGPRQNFRRYGVRGLNSKNPYSNGL